MKRVLVVEDDPRARNAICLILSNAGYGIVDCGTVREALMHLDIIDLSAIVLDLRLPNGHGTRVIESLVGKRNDVPVIILSAFAHEAPEDALVVEILQKPFKPDQLRAALRKADELANSIKSLRSTTRKLGERLPRN
jgi:DNA-binding response OmpR family regulator